MSQMVHLESSLTLVTPALLAQKSFIPIGDEIFASRDEHVILRDEVLADALRKMAMGGLPFQKLPVGSKENFTGVEFFVLDLKKSKKELVEFKKLITLRWLDALYSTETAREECNGDLFAAEMAPAFNRLQDSIDLRRFLANATDMTMMAKKKRTILLFHHIKANAPN